MIRFFYLLLLLAAGAFVSSLGGAALLFVYIVLVVDKVIFGTTQIQAVGIELTSFATIILGLNFSPLLTFAYIMVIYPLLEFSRGFLVSKEVGPEIITANFFDWILATAAWSIKSMLTPDGVGSSLPILAVVFVSLLAKDVALFLKEVIIESEVPFNPGIFINIPFNIFLFLLLGNSIAFLLPQI